MGARSPPRIPTIGASWPNAIPTFRASRSPPPPTPKPAPTSGIICELEQARQFIDSFDRPNIYYQVIEKDNGKKQLLDFVQKQMAGQSGIVYCLTRKKVEDVAAFLCEHGLNAIAYHAGLSMETREANQRRFTRDDGVIVVATVAFGMGIDKPDVRFVAHLDMPQDHGALLSGNPAAPAATACLPPAGSATGSMIG